MPVHDTLVKLHVSGRLALGAHLEGGGAGGGGARPHVGYDRGPHKGVDASHGGQQSDSRSSLHDVLLMMYIARRRGTNARNIDQKRYQVHEKAQSKAGTNTRAGGSAVAAAAAAAAAAARGAEAVAVLMATSNKKIRALTPVGLLLTAATGGGAKKKIDEKGSKQKKRDRAHFGSARSRSKSSDSMRQRVESRGSIPTGKQ